MENKMHYLFKHVDDHMDVFGQRLAQLIGIKTVAQEADIPEVRFEIGRAVTTISEFLRDKLGMTVSVIKNKKEYLPGRYPTPREPDPDNPQAEGDLFNKDDLPPIILAELGHDVNKMTVLIYGHLDTTPAREEDGWRTNPFQLDEDDEYYYGRGTSDCKGQFLAWLCAIEAFIILKIDIPLNIRIVVESLEEVGSEGLQELIFEKRHQFFESVDYIVSSDSYWLTDEKPCIAYGARGVNYFFVEVECAKKDLHSGMHGGNVHEAMSDLVYLLNSLSYDNGYLRVPNFYDKVNRASREEIKIHQETTFSVPRYKSQIGAYKLLHPTKEQLLDHRCVLPCLTLHGIKDSFDKVGSDFIIPKKVTGKFSVRIVPDQDPDEINEMIVNYLTRLHNERSCNRLKIDAFRGKKAFRNDPFDISHRAATAAVRRVWEEEPDHIRHGPAIPVMRVFQEILGKSCMLLPLCRASCANHIVNERMTKINFQNGIKVIIAYFFELSNLVAIELI